MVQVSLLLLFDWCIFLLSGCAEKEICCQHSIRFSIFVYSIRGTSYYGIWISTAPMKSISMLKPGLVSLELETIICKEKDYNSNVKCQMSNITNSFAIFLRLPLPAYAVFPCNKCSTLYKENSRLMSIYVKCVYLVTFLQTLTLFWTFNF